MDEEFIETQQKLLYSIYYYFLIYSRIFQNEIYRFAYQTYINVSEALGLDTFAYYTFNRLPGLLNRIRGLILASCLGLGFSFLLKSLSFSVSYCILVALLPCNKKLNFDQEKNFLMLCPLGMKVFMTLHKFLLSFMNCHDLLRKIGGGFLLIFFFPSHF